MDETRARGEMPFLDHLEELRWRILWSLTALVVGSVLGFLIVQHFDVLSLLKRPIAPFLPDGKLFITRRRPRLRALLATNDYTTLTFQVMDRSRNSPGDD